MRTPNPTTIEGILLFWVCLEGVWGAPPGRSGAPHWQIQGQAGPSGPVPAALPQHPVLACPACPCPAQIRLGKGSPAKGHQPLLEKSSFAMLSSNLDRVREAKCLLGALASRRAAGTGREDPQPNSNPLAPFCCETHIFCRAARGSREQESPP